MSEPYDFKKVKPCVESKVFGIGVESYTVGSSEFALTYAAVNQDKCIPLMDNGHYHPTEVVSDKIPALLTFFKEIAREIVRCGGLEGRVNIALDYFDASINRISAWTMGYRNFQKALLFALLQPVDELKKLQDEQKFSALMVAQEELKTLPFGEERNGGNLTYRIKDEEISAVAESLHEIKEWLPIGNSVPDLAGEYFLVTGSGKYMRNVELAPEENIAVIKINDTGEKYTIVWGLVNGGRPTSELPTHLANHELKKKLTGGKNRVIYHAHPTNLIALTFVLPLNDKDFTRELWEMATEDPVIFPEGLGIVPWMVPGGKEIADASTKLMEKYRVVVWAHHGLFVCGDDFDEAFGLMDTVEKAAEICVKVLSMGGKKQTIPREGFIQLAKDFNINLNTDLLD